MPFSEKPCVLDLYLISDEKSPCIFHQDTDWAYPNNNNQIVMKPGETMDFHCPGTTFLDQNVERQKAMVGTGVTSM